MFVVCNVKALDVHNGQDELMNLLLNSDVVQRRQAKRNMEAHTQGSFLLDGYTQPINMLFILLIHVLQYKLHLLEK